MECDFYFYVHTKNINRIKYSPCTKLTKPYTNYLNYHLSQQYNGNLSTYHITTLKHIAAEDAKSIINALFFSFNAKMKHLCTFSFFHDACTINQFYYRFSAKRMQRYATTLKLRLSTSVTCKSTHRWHYDGD